MALNNAETAMNLDTFRKDIQEFENTLKRVESNFKKINEEMESLSATYSGEAHTALVAQFRTDRQNAEEIIVFLKTMLGDLKFASKEYAKCEQEISDIVNAIRI